MSSNPPQKFSIFWCSSSTSPLPKNLWVLELTGLIWDDAYPRRHARSPAREGDEVMQPDFPKASPKQAMGADKCHLPGWSTWFFLDRICSNLGPVILFVRTHSKASQFGHLDRYLKWKNTNLQLQWRTKWWCFTWFLPKWLPSFNNFHGRRFNRLSTKLIWRSLNMRDVCVSRLLSMARFIF